MSSIHSLQINLGVPVRIIDDHIISLKQVDTQATCSSREDKDLLVGCLLLEIFDLQLSIIRWSLAIDTTVPITSEAQKVIKEI